jgi:uncharacterized protein YbbC (DUF1343 family)
LAADPGLLGSARRVGLTTNDAACTAADPALATRSALLAAGVPLIRLFTPEHGLGGDAPDGAPVGHGTDDVTGRPTVSLYGDHFAPPREALASLDAVLFDIPDIGVRYYTYAWTLTHLIDACAEVGVPVWVLDRPNPLGGRLEDVEGPILEPDHASFVGRHTIPVRHSLTIGELALLWRRERQPDANVRVIPCTGWVRHAMWHETGLPFVPTSPAIRTPDAALLYAGLCLFEATELSVGRGTPLSFAAVGAPWLDVAALLDRFTRRRLPGIDADADRFTPATGPHAGEPCNALRIRVLSPQDCRPVAMGLALLADIAALHPAEFDWRPYPTAANPGGHGHAQRLLGTDHIAVALSSVPEAITPAHVAHWTEAPGWEARWRSVLLYDE